MEGARKTDVRRTSRGTGRARNVKLAIKYLKLYCEYSSLVGCKYLVEKSRIKRTLWLVVYVMALCILLYIVRDAYREYESNPIITTLDPDDVPMNQLEFPGIAICSVNRISRQSAVKMATEVANITVLPVNEILDLIVQLGHIYESSVRIEGDRFREIDRLLLDFYNGSYDIAEVMKRLTPQCSVMLLICIFRGEHQNCSELFDFRKTQDGYCCTFNYASEADMETSTEATEPIEVLRVGDLGVERGLSVVMEPFLDDYFYTILPILGWKVTIFNPRDYPDATSGGVSDVILSPTTETFIEMDAASFYSSADIRGFPVEHRKCIFPDEVFALYNGYSYSDCIVDCKSTDTWKTCRCQPFYYPRHESRRVCTLLDVECLKQHDSKWWFIVAYDEENTSKSANKSSPLHCHNCYPACKDVYYNLQVWKTYMDPGFYKTHLLTNVNVVDQAVLHVYFTKLDAISLRQDIAYRWYELMSDIGGICGVFIGFSLISLVELVYFVGLLILEMWNATNRSEQPEETEDGIRKHTATTVHTIYWSELFPRSRESTDQDFRRKIPVDY